MKIALPNKQFLLDFDKIIVSLFIQIENNAKESRRLAQLRDTLLPRLMSGELKVNEIENVL
jgi:type I restriction enzyme S subunit